MKLCPKCQKHFSDDANFCPVDAARLVPLETQAAAADSLTSRFDLGARVGGNRTGAVHKATDKTTGKAVAVKLVAPAVVALPGVAQRLDRELKQLERVQSPGVAKVLASGKRGPASEEVWVAMEYLDGAHTLQEAISARGPIPVEQATHLIEVIGEALIEAAQVGVVHRDLAPKNVLFAGQDVKLVNFSLPVPDSKTPGVAEFVAPEQNEGRPVDQRSNLYSLGALYYFVLTGTTPDAANVKPPSSLGHTVPAPVEAVIMRALDRSPTKRFLTVRQFVDEVGRVGTGEVIELKQSPQARSGRPKGELVSTLMGVKGGMAPISSAPTVGSGTPAIAPSVQAGPTAETIRPATSQPAAMAAATAPTPQAATPQVQGRAQSNPMAQTAIGVPAAAVHAAVQSAMPAHVSPPTGMKPITPPSGVPVGSGAPMASPPMGQGSGAPQMAQATPSQPSAPTQSPWAPPQGGPPFSGQAAQPSAPAQPAAPVVAAPVVAAPVIAPPVVGTPIGPGAQPQGKKKADEPGTKGKFRETMWFKKGDLDAQAAVAAAEERARTGKDVASDKADSLPIDERYKDDGTISRTDKDKYSLRTGATQMMQAMRDPGDDRKGKRKRVSEDALIGEMKSGSRMIAFGIILAIIAAVVTVLALK